jgi:tape measure domain-containing protein
MAVQVGSLFASLTLESGAFTRGMVQAERTTAQAMSSIQKQAGLTGRAVEGIGRSFNQPIRPYSLIAASRAFDNTADRAALLRGSLIALTGVFGGFAAALTSNVVLRYADTYTQLNNQLRVVSTSSSDLKAQFSALEDVSERSRSGLKETAILYSRLAKAAPDVGADKLLKFTETIQKALQLGGATAQEAASAAVQFSQAIASNRLGGEELRAILETPLGGALAKGLGVTIGKLRELGTQGKLTADVVLGALEKVGPEVDRQFGQSVRTLDQAITQADNEFISYIGSVNEAYGATTILGDAILGVSGNLDTIGRVAGTVAPVIASIFAGRLIGGGLGGAVGGVVSSFQAVGQAARQSMTTAREKVLDLEGAVKTSITDFQKLNETIKAGTKNDFADTSTVKALARDIAAIQKLDAPRLEVTENINDAYRKLASISSQTTPRIISAAEAVAKAESRVNDLLAKQQQLRNAVRGNDSRQLGAAALQSQVGGSKELSQVRAAAKERIQLERDIAAAQQQAASAREALSVRISALNTAEAEVQRRNTEQQIATLKQIETLNRQALSIDEKRAAIQSRITTGVSQRDAQAVANTSRLLGAASDQSAKLQLALGGAREQLFKVSAAATVFNQSLALLGRAGSSLVGFLGGPWGVALTGATLALSIFGIRAAETAQRVKDSQRAIDEALQKSASSGDVTAQATIDQKRLEQSITDTAANLKAAQAKFSDSGAEGAIRSIALEIDNLRETSNRELFRNQTRAVGFIDDLLATLKDGGGTLDDFNRRLEAFGDRFNIPQEYIDNIKAEARSISDAAQAVKVYNNELSALNAQKAAGAAGNSFLGFAKQLMQEADAKIAVDKAAFAERIKSVQAGEQKIVDSFADALRSNGIKITKGVENYIREQARLLNALDQLKETASRAPAQRPTIQQGNVRTVGGVDPNIRGIVGQDPFSQAKVADQLANLKRIRDEIAAAQKLLVQAQAIGNGAVPLVESVFGTKADSDEAIAAIKNAKAEIATIATEFQSGKRGAVDVYNALETLRNNLKAAGGESDAIDKFIDDTSNAIISVPKLKAEIAALTSQFNALGEAAATTVLPGGSVVKKNQFFNGGGQKPILPTPPPELAQKQPVAAVADPAAAALSQQIDETKQKLTDFDTYVQSRPADLLTRSMFGDPQQFSSAASEAKTQIDDITNRLKTGGLEASKIPAEVNKLRDSLLQAGANADAINPFVAAVEASLKTIPDMVAQVNSLTAAMNNLAAAASRARAAQSGTNPPASSSSSSDTSFSSSAPSNPLPQFAKGGVFRVGGGGGVDSQLVQFMASPNETVAVMTPSQVKAMNDNMPASPVMNVQAPINIFAADAESFRQSKRQVQYDIADAVTAAVSRTR